MLDAGIIQPDKAQAVRVVWKKTLGTGYSAVTVASGLAVTMYSDGQSDYVIVQGLAKGGYNAYVGANRDQYVSTFTEELIPFIDQRYRTLRKREGRANYGTGRGGFMAFYAAIQRSDLFDGIAIQSTYWDQTNEAERDTVIPPSDTLPVFRLYLDWGTYDSRSPTEGNDTGLATSRFAAALSEKGYVFVGGQINDGAGWASWRNRTNSVFGTLFPVTAE